MNIIQVVGGPGSGKTTLAHKLLADWPDTAGLMRVDRYLRDRLSDDSDDFLLLPTSIDWPLVMAHLDLLRAGGDAMMPVYDWEQCRRAVALRPARPDQAIKAADWLIIEGLFYVPGIRSVRLFVDAPADARRARSQARDTNLSQSLGGAYDRVADAAYEKYIAPQRALADHVLDGQLDPDTLADQARRILAVSWAGWG